MSDNATIGLDRPMAYTALSRAEYEDFLYHEAALLDEWKLEEWLKLFTTDAIYEVPTAGAPDDVSSAAALFYIADNYTRLCYRVERLMDKGAHAEWPRSETARLIANVRVLGADEHGVHVTCTFATYRSKNDLINTFVGHLNYVLRHGDDGIRIASKRVMLDMNSLRSQGKVSILL